jgi:hypothetical protein
MLYDHYCLPDDVKYVYLAQIDFKCLVLKLRKVQEVMHKYSHQLRVLHRHLEVIFC